MGSQPLVQKLPALKSRVSTALRATAATTARASTRALDELSAAVEELQTVADALAEAEDGLETERRRYRELFNLAPDGYLVVDREGVIREANAAAASLLGVGGASLLGKPFAVYLGPGEAQKLHERLASDLGDRVADWETILHPRALPDVCASIRATAVRDGEGRIRGARLLLHDISDEVRAYRQERDDSLREAARLRAHAQRLEAVERQKSDFLSLVSHELKAPVTLIHGYLAMMLDGSLGDVGDRARKVLPVAIERCDEILALVEEAVQTAGLDNGWGRLVRREVDLRDLASDAVSAAAPFAGVAGRNVRLVSASEAVPVEVDAAKIRTILRNIIENALKYSWEGSEVRCEVRAHDELALVTVSDRGRGIPTAQLARLFTRFGRVITPATAHIGGTGLGLYLSRELARRHGGDLRVETVEGEGSTFTLELQLSRPR